MPALPWSVQHFCELLVDGTAALIALTPNYTLNDNLGCREWIDTHIEC
jgi:hypothetical protein